METETVRLGEVVATMPLTALLLLVLIGGYRRWWFFGPAHDVEVRRLEARIAELDAECKEWQQRALGEFRVLRGGKPDATQSPSPGQ